ncbi:TIGR02444 family protein [Skermanella rosea]|uniref:TIGR02444 family protein n=1 Tax=Skermanella rosea TaxID=1817965 RepID=UPI001E2B974E|nr:TIGR02444 family protein [Skermanella rosea]UEM02140.1 TIGR02444 family protein [Skermanella rosea]
MATDGAGEPAADPAGDLWRFALALYGRPGVSGHCLMLQDRHGCDVTVLLFAAWAGAARGIGLSARDLGAARAAVEAWHGEVVRPLRAVRRRLKQGPPPAPTGRTGELRARIQTIEIEAERIELEVLAGCLPVPAASRGRPSPELVLANLELAAPGLEGESRDALRAVAETAYSIGGAIEL